MIHYMSKAKVNKKEKPILVLLQLPVKTTNLAYPTIQYNMLNLHRHDNSCTLYHHFSLPLFANKYAEQKKER